MFDGGFTITVRLLKMIFIVQTYKNIQEEFYLRCKLWLQLWIYALVTYI